MAATSPKLPCDDSCRLSAQCLASRPLSVVVGRIMGHKVGAFRSLCVLFSAAADRPLSKDENGV